MHIYRLQRRISHADVDFLGELKVSALLGLLEQAAIEASIEAGYDAEYYRREGRIWIIRRTRLQRAVPVGGGDTIDVETHVADSRRVRSLRRYSVRKASTVIAEASTDWVYCDVATGRPARISEDLQRTFIGEVGAAAEPRAAALRIPNTEPAATLRLVVQPSHLDHVTHVNNAVYAHFLEDGACALFAVRGWPLARMLAAGGALRVNWLDTEYLSNAVLDDELLVSSWLEDDTLVAPGDVPPATAKVVQRICRADGSEVLRAGSDWVWRHKPTLMGGAPA